MKITLQKPTTADFLFIKKLCNYSWRFFKMTVAERLC